MNKNEESIKLVQHLTVASLPPPPTLCYVVETYDNGSAIKTVELSQELRLINYINLDDIDQRLKRICNQMKTSE